MAFIRKEDPIVINIKLTNNGRRKLSEGNLEFSKFALGDSEIDYQFIKDNDIDSNDINIMKPKDRNPKILSFIKKNNDSNNIENLNNIISSPFTVRNNTPSRGFFNMDDEDNPEIITEPDYIKQKDCEINIEDVTGGDELRIRQSNTYSTDIREPAINDYLLIRWTNPNNVNTNNNIIESNKPHPILFYRIIDIVAGSLFNNNLIVKVDRDLPNFTGYSGNIKAGVFVYSPNLIDDNLQSTDFLNEAIFSFFENYNLPTQDIPFWNMSLIFTKEISGVLNENKKIKNFLTSSYAGFVSYIQNQSKTHDVLGVIHYSNTSPANNYGEGFYQNTATLYLPTIIWHKNQNKIGLKLNGVGNSKILNGLDITYRDLSDQNGNIVGKIFNGLKIFVIEDPELIFAMSYKSNRNWTLPNYILDVNSNISIGCEDCTLDVDFNVKQPQNIGDNGELVIENIILSVIPGNLVGVLTNNNTQETQSKTLYINTNNITMDFNGLAIGSYDITLYDLTAPECVISHTFDIVEPQSNLSIDDVEIIEV